MSGKRSKGPPPLPPLLGFNLRVKIIKINKKRRSSIDLYIHNSNVSG